MPDQDSGDQSQQAAMNPGDYPSLEAVYQCATFEDWLTIIGVQADAGANGASGDSGNS